MTIVPPCGRRRSTAAWNWAGVCTGMEMAARIDAIRRMRCVASLRGEGPPRLLLLPAGRRRRRPARAQARDAPARGGHRDARARAGRSEVDPHWERVGRADEGVGAPGALPRAEGAKAGGGTAWARGGRPDAAPGRAPVPALPRPRRERGLGADRRPGGDP